MATQLEVFANSNFTTQIHSGTRLHTTEDVYCRLTLDSAITVTAADFSLDTCTISQFSEVSPTVFTFQISSANRPERSGCSFTYTPDDITFEFVHDIEAQVLMIVDNQGTEHGVVRLPEDYTVTPSARQREVIHTNVTARPAGYTPWTHSNMYDPQTVGVNQAVYQVNTITIPSSIRQETMVNEATRRLEETDWMLLSDVTTPGGIATYRTALRAIITSFDVSSPPTTVTWPEVPTFSTAGATTAPYPGDIALYTR